MPVQGFSNFFLLFILFQFLIYFSACLHSIAYNFSVFFLSTFCKCFVLFVVMMKFKVRLHFPCDLFYFFPFFFCTSQLLLYVLRSSSSVCYNFSSRNKFWMEKKNKWEKKYGISGGYQWFLNVMEYLKSVGNYVFEVTNVKTMRFVRIFPIFELFLIWNLYSLVV